MILSSDVMQKLLAISTVNSKLARLSSSLTIPGENLTNRASRSAYCGFSRVFTPPFVDELREFILRAEAVIYVVKNNVVCAGTLYLIISAPSAFQPPHYRKFYDTLNSGKISFLSDFFILSRLFSLTAVSLLISQIIAKFAPSYSIVAGTD